MSSIFKRGDSSGKYHPLKEAVSRRVKDLKIFEKSSVRSWEEIEEVEECVRTLNYAGSSYAGLSARRDSVEAAHPDAGKWLANDDGYAQWDSGDRSGLLLIRGKPGSGKSTLSRKILDAMRLKYEFTSHKPDQAAEKKQRNLLVADFSYSTGGRDEKVSHTLMLRSLLYQLLSGDGRLFPLFRDTYRARKSHKTVWVYEDLKRVFESLTSLKADWKIYIFLDAVSESSNQGRSEILRLLLKLCSSSSGCTFKCLIATRPLAAGELDEKTSICHVINMQDKNQGDIDRITTARLHDIRDEYPWFSPHFNSTHHYITEHAQGVFVWVTLVLEQLARFLRPCPSERELSYCLGSLPLELEGMYERIIRNLAGNNRARRTLIWATFTERPLEADEFRDAMAMPLSTEPFRPEPTFLRKGRVPDLEQHIRVNYGPLVETRQSVPNFDQPASRLVVQLLHPTAREFLMRSQPKNPFYMNEKRGNEEIVASCIRYIELLPTSLPGGAKELDDWEPDDYTKLALWLADFRLLEYIAAFLPKHMKSLTDEARVHHDMRLSQALGENDVMYCLFEYCVRRSVNIRIEARHTEAYASRFRNKCLLAALRPGCREVVRLIGALEPEIKEPESGDPTLPTATGKKDLGEEKVLPTLPTKFWGRIRHASKRMSKRVSKRINDKSG